MLRRLATRAAQHVQDHEDDVVLAFAPRLEQRVALEARGFALLLRGRAQQRLLDEKLERGASVLGLEGTRHDGRFRGGLALTAFLLVLESGLPGLAGLFDAIPTAVEDAPEHFFNVEAHIAPPFT